MLKKTIFILISTINISAKVTVYVGLENRAHPLREEMYPDYVTDIVNMKDPGTLAFALSDPNTIDLIAIQKTKRGETIINIRQPAVKLWWTKLPENRLDLPRDLLGENLTVYDSVDDCVKMFELFTPEVVEQIIRQLPNGKQQPIPAGNICAHLYRNNDGHLSARLLYPLTEDSEISCIAQYVFREFGDDRTMEYTFSDYSWIFQILSLPETTRDGRTLLLKSILRHSPKLFDMIKSVQPVDLDRNSLGKKFNQNYLDKICSFGGAFGGIREIDDLDTLDRKTIDEEKIKAIKELCKNVEHQKINSQKREKVEEVVALNVELRKKDDVIQEKSREIQALRRELASINDVHNAEKLESQKKTEELLNRVQNLESEIQAKDNTIRNRVAPRSTTRRS